MIHLDTSYLVDLLREKRRGADGPATRRLEDLTDAELRVSVHALCELFAGAERSSRRSAELQAVEALTAGFEIVYPDARFAPTYGRLLAPLQTSGSMISTMDLLIATAAVVDTAPILTGNPRHFERVDGLQVMTY